MTFYNDSDAGACAWTRELMADGLISQGIVDERPIEEITGDDIRGYTRVALFNGISGWDYALQLAGWDSNRPVWSASVPCQGFSNAGKRKGHGDARNLWPEVLRLVRECRPPTLVGEQVPGAIRFGWIDGVFTDLEKEGYACGAVVLGAHSVGAPHIRQRLYWVASRLGDSDLAASKQHAGKLPAAKARSRRKRQHNGNLPVGPTNAGDCVSVRLADSECDAGRPGRVAVGPGSSDEAEGTGTPIEPGRCSDTCGHADGPVRLGDSSRTGQQVGRNGKRGTVDPQREAAERAGDVGGLGDTDSIGESAVGRVREGAGVECEGSHSWRDSVLIPCRDGKLRRIPRSAAGQAQSGFLGVDDGLSGDVVDLWLQSFPLAQEKIEGRVGLLRGYGNAIVPHVAATFIRAVMEALREHP